MSAPDRSWLWWWLVAGMTTVGVAAWLWLSAPPHDPLPEMYRQFGIL